MTVLPRRCCRHPEHRVCTSSLRPVSVTPGHALIIPNRHVPYFFDITEAERSAMYALVVEMRGPPASTSAPWPARPSRTYTCI
ncbi:HIT family protein [Cupriavidus sp. BIC8F]|uniref:HIT family protein n=1 Tax=Cupriavidus sp. BIC8F TaxID=3079014 RepID=UPI00396779B2